VELEWRWEVLWLSWSAQARIRSGVRQSPLLVLAIAMAGKPLAISFETAPKLNHLRFHGLAYKVFTKDMQEP
jgi:hypothetical protein